MDKKNYLSVIGIVSFLVSLGTLTPAWASVDLNAFLPIDGSLITPTFTFSKTVSIDYSNGGKLKDALEGRSLIIAFTDDSIHNPSIESLVEHMNTELATDRKTAATISRLTVDYLVKISGDQRHATFDYLVTLSPTLAGYTLSRGDFNSPVVFDLSWMGFTIRDPVTITTKQYGNLEINFPLDVVKNQIPGAYDMLKGTQAESILGHNLIDASSLLSLPIDRWDTLFDPAYQYVVEKVPVTTFSSNQIGSVPQVKENKIDLDFTVDALYHLSTVESASSGTLNVEGHANGHFVQGLPAISTTIAANVSPSPVGIFSPGSILPILFMLVFAAAAGILWWSNKWKR